MHELAKDVQATTKQVLTYLRDQGEFVKSGSSTVPGPVARRVRKEFPAWQEQRESAKAERVPESRPSEVTAGRPRPRTLQMPPIGGRIDSALLAAAAQDAGDGLPDLPEVADLIGHFAIDPDGRYGYLAWRFWAAREQSPLHTATAAAPNADLGLIAQVIDSEKHLIDSLVRSHGQFYEKPLAARRLLEEEFRELTDADEIGQSAEDELRRVRAHRAFITRATVLLITDPDLTDRLWEMLETLPRFTADHLVETTPRLLSEIARLSVLAASTDALLQVDDATLGQFLELSRAELADLRSGRYDCLVQFLDKTSTSARLNLGFELLPRGEQLRTFIGDLQRTRRLHGYDVDYRRLDVLQEIEAHFGEARCQWHIGSNSSQGVNNQYLVLSIKDENSAGEHAVAISPIAGMHATYVVKADTGNDWRFVLAQSKSDARALGAQRLLFTHVSDGLDGYSAMRDRVIRLIEP